MAFRGGRWGTVRAVLPQVADTVYAFGSLAISASMLHNWPDPHHYWRTPDALAYALIAAVYLPLAVRRRAPLLILATTAAAVLVYFTLAYYHPVAVCGLALANYTVAAHRPRTVSVPCTVTTWLVLLWGTRLAEPGIGMLSVAFVTATAAVTWVTGDVSRRFAERGRRLAALTEQLRREQEERTRRAVSDECMRIARELHDVIAHHVSVISIQAGLADYVFTTDPATAHQAVGVISGSARDAGEEMRRMLAVLRHGVQHTAYDRTGTLPDADGTPPGLARLEELADRVRAAGVPVRITGGLAEPLPAGLDMCVYRVVQEALTNVLKHAPTATATVSLSRGRGSIRVRVTDDGPARPRTEERDGPGHGLLGMRERATIYGGTVTAGARSQGGFEVDLVMPVPEP
ncbi:sensor histidine kinase [Streptomyces sp. NPDC012794]|uniref:sensor histidine kinase n=1 Tax=Streptomyces sp. NPDC012794 TaxID=3364850 RepID=UPI00369944AA